jgi:hypothetical protein
VFVPVCFAARFGFERIVDPLPGAIVTPRSEVIGWVLLFVHTSTFTSTNR